MKAIPCLLEGNVYGKPCGETWEETVSMSKDTMDRNVYEAAKSGDCERVRELMQQRATLGFRDVFGMQAHHVAARHGHANVIEVIFATTDDNGSALLNAKASDHKQVLHYAAAFGHVELAGMLLACGANPEALDKWGNKPLDLARLRQESGKMTDAEFAAMQMVFAPFKKAKRPQLGNIPHYPKSPFSKA